MTSADIQVFISYDSDDFAVASRLAQDLREREFPVWMAPDSIRPGESWVEGINRGLETCSHFVVLLTPEAIESRWVRQEVNTAIARERDGRVRLIPLELAPCELPALWSGYQWISFRESYARGVRGLVAELKAGDGGDEREVSSARPSGHTVGTGAREWAEIDTYARLYDALYPRLPGDLRNYVLNSVIVDQVQQLGSVTGVPAALPPALFDRGSDGDRLVALLLAQTAPAPGYLDFALEAIQASRSPFEQFHGLRAVEVMTHLLGRPEVDRLLAALRAARQKFLVPANRSRWEVYENILQQLDVI